jgi:2-oxo-4-hydroxy-4-carboxy--5-ureidoimidazoline (OHCU) decarboxylase
MCGCVLGQIKKTKMFLEHLNKAPKEEFIEVIRGPLEGESWLAERIYAKRPFISLNELIQAFQTEFASMSQADR